MKKTIDHQHLWREAMDEGLPEGIRRDSLAAMLGGVRSRRRRRNAARWSAAGLSVAAAVVMAVLCLRDAGETVPPVVETLPAPEVSYLSDEELFALFSGEPVGIVNHGEAQQFIMLDGR